MKKKTDWVSIGEGYRARYDEERQRVDVRVRGCKATSVAMTRGTFQKMLRLFPKVS